MGHAEPARNGRRALQNQTVTATRVRNAGWTPTSDRTATRPGAAAGPTFDSGHLTASGDIPDVTTWGDPNWPLVGRGQRCCYASCGQGHPEPGDSAESLAQRGHTTRPLEVTVRES